MEISKLIDYLIEQRSVLNFDDKVINNGNILKIRLTCFNVEEKSKRDLTLFIEHDHALE